MLTQDPDTVTGYTLTGCVRSMFSNRISYTFDLQGPSFSVDTACSSSLLALQLAVDSIRQVRCFVFYASSIYDDFYFQSEMKNYSNI